MLQEAISEEQVQASAEEIGLEPCAISDFPPVEITGKGFRWARGRGREPAADRGRGGDLKIQAPGRHLLVGTDPAEDCVPHGTCEGVYGPGALDGYQDSIGALLMLDGARLLSAGLPETYVPRHFPGGAIALILAAGPRAEVFDAASMPEAEAELFRVGAPVRDRGGPGGVKPFQCAAASSWMGRRRRP